MIITASDITTHSDVALSTSKCIVSFSYDLVREYLYYPYFTGLRAIKQLAESSSHQVTKLGFELNHPGTGSTLNQDAKSLLSVTFSEGS